MNFANLLFLYILLPLTLLVYFFMPDNRRKNIVLVIASFLFYSMEQPVYLLLLGGLSWLNYRFSLRIRPRRRHSLYMPLAVNIAVFVLFQHVDALLGIIGIGSETGGLLLGLVKKLIGALNSAGMSLKEPESLLPVGLPFYLITVISYFMDIYNGKIKAEKDFLNVLTFLTMFPKLAQGPIVRYEQVNRQLVSRRVNPRLIFEGAVRFVTGLSKKVLLADYCARVISGLSGGGDQTLVGAWLCALLYTYRIYFDFSGCCDMAIGLSKIFGFRFSENFDYPYSAVSVTEFCQKWNLTLRSFFRENVYTSLGGSGKGQVSQVINYLIVWVLVGLWHGGGINYLVWALFLFVVIMLENLLESQLVDLPRALRHFLTMLALLFSWVFFAHEDLVELGTALKGLLGFGGFTAPGVARKLLNSLPLILLCALASSPQPRQIGYFWANLCNMSGKQRRKEAVLASKIIYLASMVGYVCLLLWLCSVSLGGYGDVPSIFGGM